MIDESNVAIRMPQFCFECVTDLTVAKDRFERLYLEMALVACGCNQVRAAAALKIHRNTLSRRLQDLGIDAQDMKHAAAVERRRKERMI